MSRFFASLVLGSTLVSQVAVADRAGPLDVPHDSGQVAAETNTELRVAPPRVDRAKVRAALVANRRANLARFRAYYRRGIYPNNVYRNGKANVWRDEAGRLCAAATIMTRSGEAALAMKIAEENNFIRLADVQQGPVMDWILASGFTQAELVAIQKPFSRVGTLEQGQPMIDERHKTAEARRLLALYQQVDRQLVRNETRSLELAVDRLMKQPALAMQLVAKTSR